MGGSAVTPLMVLSAALVSWAIHGCGFRGGGPKADFVKEIAGALAAISAFESEDAANEYAAAEKLAELMTLPDALDHAVGAIKKYTDTLSDDNKKGERGERNFDVVDEGYH